MRTISSRQQPLVSFFPQQASKDKVLIISETSGHAFIFQDQALFNESRSDFLDHHK